MSKKPAKSTGPVNAPQADAIKTIAAKIDGNPIIRAALLEAMKKGKARHKERQ